MRYEESDEFKLLCARVDELFDRAAGDLAAAGGSMLGMLPSDMIDVLPRLYHFAEE